MVSTQTLLQFSRPSRPRSADHQGLTALHVAASAGSASLCALLLRLQASLEQRDLQGRTALGGNGGRSVLQYLSIYLYTV